MYLDRDDQANTPQMSSSPSNIVPGGGRWEGHPSQSSRVNGIDQNGTFPPMVESLYDKYDEDHQWQKYGEWMTCEMLVT